MRTCPNYFKFRQWLYWAMKDSPLSNDHFHADEIYQDNLLDETEVLPAAFILSYGASMLEDARKYFHKHTYSSKTPTLFCNFSDIEYCDPSRFECGNFIPDFSTIEKTAALFSNNGFPADISFYANSLDLYKKTYQGYNFLKRICTTAPLWFGTQYNMIYCQLAVHSEEYGSYIAHWAEFYHSIAIDYFPFEKDKWITLANNSENYPLE